MEKIKNERWDKIKGGINDIKKRSKEMEEVISNILGYHSFYGKFSIFLFLSSALFFMALVFGNKSTLSLINMLYYFLIGLSAILIFNIIKISYIVKWKGRMREEIIYGLDVMQTISISTLIYIFLNIAVGNDIYGKYRVMLFIFTLIVLVLSLLARRDILFRYVIKSIYNTHVSIAKEHYKGKGRVIIMNQEMIDKINYYSSYAIFLWYLISFMLCFVSDKYHTLKLLLYGYFLPAIVLLFFYSYIYSYFRKKVQ